MIKLVVNNDTEYVAENGGQIIVEYLSDGVKGIANLNTDKAEHDIAYLNNVDRLHVKIINKEQREAIKYKNIVYLDICYDYNKSVIKVQGFCNNEMAVLSGDYEFISDRIVDFVKILAKDVYCTVRMDCCGIGVIIKDLLEDNDIKVESIELNKLISENQKLKNLSDDQLTTEINNTSVKEKIIVMYNDGENLLRNIDVEVEIVDCSTWSIGDNEQIYDKNLQIKINKDIKKYFSRGNIIFYKSNLYTIYSVDEDSTIVSANIVDKLISNKLRIENKNKNDIKNNTKSIWEMQKDVINQRTQEFGQKMKNLDLEIPEEYNISLYDKLKNCIENLKSKCVDEETELNRIADLLNDLIVIRLQSCDMVNKKVKYSNKEILKISEIINIDNNESSIIAGGIIHKICNEMNNKTFIDEGSVSVIILDNNLIFDYYALVLK